MDDCALPRKQGLYDPSHEHDACGIGFLAHIKNVKSHDVIRRGLGILCNLRHRGAVGADPLAGDGSGILIQLPDAFLRQECDGLGFALPAPGDFAVGMVFLPRHPDTRQACIDAFAKVIPMEGQSLLGWRDVPTDDSVLGFSVKPIEPVIRQVFVARGPECRDVEAFERKLFVIRKQVHHEIWDKGYRDADQFYIPSLSTRTIVYKGMILAENLSTYYPDLRDERMVSALALVHQRFSTNTFPSWKLAHPFRYLCHNGEINTLRGNINWMMARRQTMKSELLGADLDKLWPLIGDGASDSATFDNAIELLVAGGYSLPHAMMMMIPEAWDDNPLMDEKRRAFYEYHAALMEPWDGPAGVAFTDGRMIGATLDRNGLRPARYVITDDDYCVMSSEVGVLDIPEEKIVKKWRLQPGKMFLIDLEQGRIIDDAELKEQLAAAKPYQQWLDATQIRVEKLPPEVGPMTPDPQTLLDQQQAFGYTQEDLRFFLQPMGLTGEDPIGSMGRDTPLAVLSDRPKMLSDYFKQCFAQVTNPPVDPIREELVMSLVSLIGPRPNLLQPEGAAGHKRLEVRTPILSNVDLERVRRIENHVDNAFRTFTLDITYSAAEAEAGMDPALARLFAKASDVVRQGYNIIILSDRALCADRIAIPALLATAGVHHYLIREGLRTSVGLVVETGEARQVHDFCLLAGYGAEAINPYLAFDTLANLIDGFAPDVTEAELHKRYIKAVSKGILKVMSKMGISTYQSYCGGQIFDAIGLSKPFVDTYFTGTRTPVEGVGLAEIAAETVRRHRLAYGNAPVLKNALDVGGDIQYRLRGEEHMWTPETVALLQHAARSGDYAKFKAYTRKINDQARKLKNLRGLFELKKAATPVPLDEVESGRLDRQALRHRGDVVRLDLLGSAHHARHRHEPDRRQVEHRRGRRGELALQAAAERRFDALGDQAGGLGSLRRHRRVPGQRRRPADQDRPGRQARRGRPAARPQGRRLDRPGPAFDARGWADLAAAAPRHLFDRGPGAADLRSEERQSGSADQRQAGLGSGRRHHRRRRFQGARRPRHHRRLRGRHRCEPGHLDPARRPALGSGPGRDPSDAGAERSARPHRRPGRRRLAHRPRRRRRRAARCRRVRFRHRGADLGRLHHDAQVPPQHLSGRRRHPGPGAAQALHRRARPRRQLHELHRRRGSRDHGGTGLPQVRGHDRPGRSSGDARRPRSLEGQGARLQPHVLPARRRAGGGAA